MLPGIAFAVVWLLILVVSMSETSLTFASRAKLEDAISDVKRRRRFLKYLELAPRARPACIILRVGAISLLFLLAMSHRPETGGLFLYWSAPAAAAAAAELLGRRAGKVRSTPTLLSMLPLLQIPGRLGAHFRPACSGPGDGGPPPAAPDEQVVDAAIEEIRVAVKDAASEGAIHHDERDMIEGVLEFEDVEVREIMTPRTDMECVDAREDACSLLNRMAAFHHTRIPVYEEVRDKVVGILHVKDLVPMIVKGTEGRPPDIRGLMQKPFFIPESKRAMSLLRDFKQRRLQIAVILDEYGGVTGLVTMEDIMEQIVGELEEGFDGECVEDRIRVLGGGELDVDARLHVDELNEILNADLPEGGDYDTIGGFMMARTASVPEAGERLECNGIVLEVLDSNDRRINRILVRKKDRPVS